MTRKRKKRNQKERPHRSASAVNPNPPQKRRLPTPKGTRSRAAAQQSLEWADRTKIDPLENPFVAELVEVIHHAATISGIRAYTILADFAAMLEANLRNETEIFKHRLLNQDPWQDMPEDAAIFTRARTRILRASEKRPVVYQKMNEAFLTMIKILMQAADYGLDFYVENRQFSPDVIGGTA